MGTTRGSNARSDTRSTASASQLSDQKGGRKKLEDRRLEAANAREKRIDERSRRWWEAREERRSRSPSTSDPGEKKRWNSVVYPVIYNWKLGATTRPKAIRRFHSGESPFFVLPKVVRPSTRIDAPSADSRSFLFLLLLYRFFLFPPIFLSSFNLPRHDFWAMKLQCGYVH